MHLICPLKAKGGPQILLGCLGGRLSNTSSTQGYGLRSEGLTWCRHFSTVVKVCGIAHGTLRQEDRGMTAALLERFANQHLEFTVVCHVLSMKEISWAVGMLEKPPKLTCRQTA